MANPWSAGNLAPRQDQCHISQNSLSYLVALSAPQNTPGGEITFNKLLHQGYIVLLPGNWIEIKPSLLNQITKLHRGQPVALVWPWPEWNWWGRVFRSRFVQKWIFSSDRVVFPWICALTELYWKEDGAPAACVLDYDRGWRNRFELSANLGASQSLTSSWFTIYYHCSTSIINIIMLPDNQFHQSSPVVDMISGKTVHI